MIILAIDPGNEQSAWCLYDSAAKKPICHSKGDNDLLLDAECGVLWRDDVRGSPVDHLAIEMIASYGMPVGREVFETCVWIGRFVESWGGPYTFVYRKNVKLHLCNSPRANDATIRQALIDRYGGKQAAIGTKRAPGPLYGVKADVWSALAIAVTYSETCAKSKPIASWSVSA